MWSLLQAAYGSYSFEEREDRTPGILDPITCARRLRKDELKRIRAAARACGLFFAVEMITILIDDQKLMSLFHPDGPRQIRYTNVKYTEHFKQLESFCLLEEETQPEKIKFFSTYFSVPKSEPVGADRAIFNGKKLGEHFSPPPSTNLADVPRILKEIKKISDESPNGLSFVSGDFRHFFHQLEVSESSSSLFGLALAGKGKVGPRFFRYRGMPMGWCFSPIIAQSVSWAVLTHHEREEKNYFEIPETGLENPPMFLFIKDGEKIVGLMTVYYDNYLVCTADDQMAKDISARILRNAKHFGVVIKEHFCWTTEQLTLLDPETGTRCVAPPDNQIPHEPGAKPKKCEIFTFLGVEIAYIMQR